MSLSSSHLSFPRQVISTIRAYPCPRCPLGTIEVMGPSEAFECSDCLRHYVALYGGHYLHPAQRTGRKIMPIFWWDGFHWHRSGNTATKSQLLLMVLLSVLPALAFYLPMRLHLWDPGYAWCHSMLAVAGIALASLQIIWLLSWDFDFLTPANYQNQSKPVMPQES